MIGKKIARPAAVALLLVSVSVNAGRVVDTTFFSTVLQTTTRYVVVVPDDYGENINQRYPVLYMLHCLGGQLEHFISTNPDYFPYCPRLQDVVEDVGFIFAAPDDSEKWGWWLDSPVRDSCNFSTFLVDEFKPLVDSLFRTLPNPENTGVAGHSMGGFGALHNFIEHPDVFGAAFAWKPGLDATIPPRNSWPNDLATYAVLGDDPANYDRVNILKNASGLGVGNRPFGFYDGEHDWWFIGENEDLHDTLNAMGIPHTFWISPGEEHNEIPVPNFMRAMDFFDSTIAAQAPVADQEDDRLARPWRPKPYAGGSADLVRIDGRRIHVPAGHAPRDFLSTGVFFMRDELADTYCRLVRVPRD